ncbi:MAG: sigma-54 dependent transcriptional regulator [Desulfovibrio sp.]|jgi:two-component system NtrC family response regulator|nr:sigma-54 dependent transcriptional regulator [Desulfovibrio sp.]
MTDDQCRLLLIDDEKNYLLILETLLQDAGYPVTAINDPESALAFLDESEVDVIITDMKMPKLSGKDVLTSVKRDYPHIPVLVMTAFGSIDSAVDLMKMGAFDYITKPFSNDDLLLSIRKASELAKAHRQYRLLHENLEERYGLHRIIGIGKGIRAVLSLVDKAAPSKSNVLISGESGTGKELVARALHFASPRKDGPFISVNCMALNPGVLESELFGHEKGSFTGAVALRRGRFELANGGTLFLDEIGELSPDLQVKLLRVLQERKFERVGGSGEIEVDIRVVTATNKDLPQEVEKGNFREDLYYRLNVVSIHLPPLRERREDIPPLLAHFMGKIAQENNITPKSISPEALEYLSGYEWPGNIRQLENVLERCMVMVNGENISAADLPPEVKDEDAQLKNALDMLPVEMNLADTLDRLEAAIIRRALARADFVQVKAADYLGISKSLLQYKLRKYSITGH